MEENEELPIEVEKEEELTSEEQKKVDLPINEQKEEETAPKEVPFEPSKIVPRVIEDEMKASYLDYAMSVIVSRALPDVKDGLKPVHRRILFAMHDMGMFHNKAYKKSARIVGEVLGKYHPHGDSAVYDAMVRMTQDFSLRYPLVDGQGNFGSVDGDSAAAMRYTEARMDKKAEDILSDIDKDTVDFRPNFDASLKEPIVLPSKIPNLLVNGSSGIAVGMATNIPPHNMTEVCDGAIKLIENPELSVKELAGIITGPDFPTGATICGSGGIMSAYLYGKGKIKVRAKTEDEEKNGRERIIVTELPYQVNKALLIEHIASLVRAKIIHGIHDLRDESDRRGMRIVIELKKDAARQVVLNQLYAHTRMQTTFGAAMLALVDGQPVFLNLKQMIEHFIQHRKEVVTRRTKFELDKAEKRAHILEGLLVALKNIDPVIKLIKASTNVEAARTGLIENFALTELQANAILDMKLQKLTSLETNKIKQEHDELTQLVEELKSILASEEKIYGIIKTELKEMKDKYGDDRRTEIAPGDDNIIAYEDMITEEEMVITVTHSGYIKRLPIDTYKEQRRGGKGVIATTTKDEDFVEDIFTASTHSYLLFFTNKGKVYWLKVYHIPVGSRQARGKSIINLIEIDENEKVNAIIPVKEFNDDQFLMLATKKGIVKKTNLSAYSKPRKGGIIAINLEEEDFLVNAALTNGHKQILIATKKGMAVKFNEQDARPIGRTSKGVKGITLRKGDEVIDMVIADNNKTLLTITENGYGKRTVIPDYRTINRGGIGVINIKTTPRNGDVVAVKSVSDNDDLMFISKDGIAIRVPASDVSTIGRNTQGVRIMRMAEKDKVVAAAKVVKEE